MPNPDGCVERAKEVPPDASPLPFLSRLRAPSTRSRRPAAAPAASAPSIPSTTGSASAAPSRASGSRRARPRSGGTPTCCPSRRRRSRGSRPASPRSSRRRGSPRSSASRELWLKLDTANPTHSFKDRVVAVAARKAQELGLGTLSCSSTGNLAGAVAARAAAEGLEAAVFVPADLEPEKLTAAAAYGPTIYAVDGHYDHCSRLSVELSFELPWGFVNVNLRSYYAEGSKTLAYEIAEQLGWRAPDVVVAPIASGALFHKVGQGFARAPHRSVSSTASAPRARRRPGRGLRARRHRVPRADDRSRRCARTRSPARSRSEARPTATSRSRRRARPAARSTRSPRRRSARTWRCSRATTGVFGETAAGVTLGALRAAVAAGEVRARDRVVLLVTGDGLEDAGPGGAHVRAGRDRGRRRRVPRRRARGSLSGWARRSSRRSGSGTSSARRRASRRCSTSTFTSSTRSPRRRRSRGFGSRAAQCAGRS